MYTNFSREICLLYARTFVAMDLWNSTIADHVKQECQRVLASWGSSLTKNAEKQWFFNRSEKLHYFVGNKSFDFIVISLIIKIIVFING